MVDLRFQSKTKEQNHCGQFVLTTAGAFVGRLWEKSERKSGFVQLPARNGNP